MSHIPASKMPHPKVHDADLAESDVPTGPGAAPEPEPTTATPEVAYQPQPEPQPTAGETAAESTTSGTSDDKAAGSAEKTATGTQSDFPFAALAFGGLLAVGAIAAAVIPLLQGSDDDTKPGKKKKKKKARADAA